MALLSIVAFICFVTIVGGLAWWALNDRELNCTNNGCTGDCDQGRTCVCGWPGSGEQCQPGCWRFPTGSKP
jgi:hypothetical protein